MKTQYYNPRTLILSLLLTIGSAATAGTISQSPLFVTSSLDPNIMFIIDDSGSMNLSFVPGSLCDWNTDTNLKKLNLEIVATAASINGLAYNPATTYTPPLNANGASLGNSSFSNAWTNGFAQSTSTKTNLGNSGYKPTFSASGAGCDGQSASVTPITTSAAFYYLYSPGATGCALPGNKYTIACYKKVIVAASEQQNFANWYSYYRTRLMATKAGASRAFAPLDTGVRVGYGRLNNTGSTTIDGISVSTIVRGVRAFIDIPSTNNTTNFRSDYFNWLFGLTASSTTPTRQALDAAGKYFSNDTANGPWSTTPGSAGGTKFSCRQCYTVLMTDGYWNTSFTLADQDSSAGQKITHADGVTSFTYSPVAPFKDTTTGTTYSNTLADVAMYYWKRDISTLANNVPVSAKDPAFWQHMSTYGIGLGVPTSINPATAFAAISTGAAINWPDPISSGTQPALGQEPSSRIDDLLHAGVNGHGGYLNAGDTDSFVNALQSTLTAITDNNKTSASAAAANSTSLQGDTLLYLARFKPGDWYGTLTAYPIIVAPGTTQNGAISSTPNWEAGGHLPLPANRHIFTLNPSASSSPKGIDTQQFTNLTANQQAALNKPSPTATADAKGAQRLSWLRGDTSLEQRFTGGIFRNRATSVLGDIVDSDPTFVGTPDYGYGALPAPEGSAYLSFRSDANYLNRTPTIYVGANDGMLHAFDARKDNGTTVTTGGDELFAYIPNFLFTELSKLTAPTYVHQYFVDGDPSVGDAYFGSAWHSMLVGTAGAGGRGLFALDITHPDSFGTANVLWEFTNTQDSDLGYTLPQPSIVRTHDTGHPWMVIVGNGYNSDNGHAVLLLLDAQSGALIRKIDTGYPGNTSLKNGLSSPLPVDTNGDKIIDAVYAGDLYGNLWKFDFSSSNSSAWDVAYKTGGVNTPLFVACQSSGSCLPGDRRPITSKPNAGAVSGDQAGGLMIYFGTGKYFEIGDDVISGTPQIETFYGIWDNGAAITNRSDLQEQTIIFEGVPTAVTGTATNKQRVVSNNAVCYATTSVGCTTNSPLKKGWALNLLEAGINHRGERVVSNALLRNGFVIFPTVIPDPDPCIGGGHGWLMEVGAFTGGRIDISPFDANNDTLVNSGDKVTIPALGTQQVTTSGMDMGIGLLSTPVIVLDTQVEHKYLSGSTSAATLADYTPPAVIPTTLPSSTPLPAGRQAWRQLR